MIGWYPYPFIDVTTLGLRQGHDELRAGGAAAARPGRGRGHRGPPAARADRIVAPMPASQPTPQAPVTTVAEAVARMEAIGAAVPASDGLACFNRMYLQVTQTVGTDLGQGFFADPAFMTTLDVTFANLYFAAAQPVGGPAPGGPAPAPGSPAPSGGGAAGGAGAAAVPTAWRPLLEMRGAAGIEPIQFALAGMNAHINHDLPVAVVSTCTELGTAPSEGSHLADFQKVDALLDAAEGSIRRSFESELELAADHHLRAVNNLVACWAINSARDLAWRNALVLWELRGNAIARGLFLDGLASATALASRLLLTPV